MEAVTFEVVSDDIVDVIGNGIALPKGVYPGVVEWQTVAIAGEPQRYLALAKLFVSGSQLGALGLQNARDAWYLVTGHVDSGKIRVVIG
jgi:hypothetical protein